MPDFTPTVWVRSPCPYSFKLRLFLTEAGHADRVNFVPMDPDAPDYATEKAELTRRAGRRITFPTAEIAPGEFLSDSDALIAHFAALHGIDPAALPTFAFYLAGLFPAYVEMEHILASPLGRSLNLDPTPRALR